MSTSDETETPLALTVGARIGDRYEIVHANGNVEPPGPARPVGPRGGAGDVYRAMFNKMQSRAIKFLTANALSSEPRQVREDFERTFRRERVFLARLSHGHIVRFYDTGVAEIDGTDREYIVTEFIDGKHDIRHTLMDEADGEECYRLIGEILRALRYMHSIGIGHGDVKRQNMRCRQSGNESQAVLLDLGAAQQFADLANSAEGRLISKDLEEDGISNPDKGFSSDPLFVTSEENLHESLHIYHRNRVTVEDLGRIFPFHDLYCVGKFLEDILKVEKIRDKLTQALKINGMRALEMICERLLEGRPEECYYRSMSHLYEDWEKLRHGYLSPVEVPELSLASEFKYSIATPLGRVVITPRLASVVEHKFFQRLRDLPQLELMKLRYTGATHTRQERAVLTFRNTRYYLAHLLNGPFFRLMVNRQQLEAALVLSLIRGVGHYQYSHFFEDYAIEQKAARRRKAAGGTVLGPRNMWDDIQYDIPTDRDLFLPAFDWSDDGGLVGDYNEALKSAARRSSENLDIPLPDVLASAVERAFSPVVVQEIRSIHAVRHSMQEGRQAAHRVLAAVLDSDVDADKVSYLTADASETGVKFGAGIDLDGLLGAIRAPSPVDLKNGRGPLIGITQKGLAAAESIMMSRSEMYEHVYWHHSTRAIAAMVKYCITRLLLSEKFSLPDFISETFFMGPSSVLQLLWSKFEELKDPGSINPIAWLMEGERGIYKQVFETDSHEAMQYRVQEVAELEDRLAAYVAERWPTANVRPGEVVIDRPIRQRGSAPETSEPSVLVYQGADYGPGAKLVEAAALVRAREPGSLRGHLCRVYVSRRVFDEIDGDSLQAHIAEYLR